MAVLGLESWDPVNLALPALAGLWAVTSGALPPMDLANGNPNSASAAMAELRAGCYNLGRRAT
jgi:hypothetical protein